MATLIMPQGTAIWLIENTALTFEQISDFCGLHPLEVQALADEQVSAGMIGIDPVNLGQLTREEIERCSRNPTEKLHMAPQKNIVTSSKSKKKYTPLLKRQERPNAIAWLIKFFPDLGDSSICSLVSTTKNTVQSVRDKTHARMSEIRPKDPVLLGFCTQVELDAAVSGIKRSSAENKDSK
ncbi:MAG: DUF1013 domain-containing protein [Holosporaceae bacterium]|nr:DUF1013 domain-containing protein [Holosporaceae bacterium]